MSINIMDFYSVRIAVVCIVEGADDLEDGYTQDIQVHILKAKDRKSAFDQAVKIGFEQETSYLNEFKQNVVWKFRKIEDIKCLGRDIVNREASSRMEGFFPEEPLTIESKFHPEESEVPLL